MRNTMSSAPYSGSRVNIESKEEEKEESNLREDPPKRRQAKKRLHGNEHGHSSPKGPHVQSGPHLLDWTPLKSQTGFEKTCSTAFRPWQGPRDAFEMAVM